ncbi:MAG: formyltransferase family protein [Potamolinea sp.]
MKSIVIFCNEDIIANITLNFLLPSLVERNFKVHIFLSQKVSRKQEDKVELLSKFNFYTKHYTSQIVYPWIEENIDSNPIFLMTFHQLSEKYNCSLYRIQSTKRTEDLDKIIAVYQENKPYVSLSVRNNLIISSKVIEVARDYGLGKIFNIHSSKLPERAGVWCALRDLAEGKSLYGTLHIVDEGIDTGSIIKIYQIDINKKYSYIKNLCLIYRKGVYHFLDMIDKLSNGCFSVQSQKQDNRKRQYCSTPTEEEVNQIESLGIKIFSHLEYQELINYCYGVIIHSPCKMVEPLDLSLRGRGSVKGYVMEDFAYLGMKT